MPYKGFSKIRMAIRRDVDVSILGVDMRARPNILTRLMLTTTEPTGIRSKREVLKQSA